MKKLGFFARMVSDFCVFIFYIIFRTKKKWIIVHRKNNIYILMRKKYLCEFCQKRKTSSDEFGMIR